MTTVIGLAEARGACGLPEVGPTSLGGATKCRQRPSPARLAEQREAIEQGCRHLGLELIDVVRDHEPGDPSEHQRPGLLYALERIDAGEAGCLIVSDLERLSGSVGELDRVLDRLETRERRLVALNVELTPRRRRDGSLWRPGPASAPAPSGRRPKARRSRRRPGVDQPSRRVTRALGYASVPADGDAAGRRYPRAPEAGDRAHV
jgi:hypothetical protein